MIWKLVTTLLFLFWAVMTGLLVRNTYFAESPALTEVPPRRVFDLFFQQATANVNTLHLYHHQEKLGRATISTVESKNRQTGVLQRRLLIAGTVENPAAGRGSATSVWQLDLDLNHESLPRSLKFEFTATQTKHRFLVAWKEGGEPKVELRPARPGDIRRSVGDGAKARHELRFAARRSLGEGLLALAGNMT